MREVSYADLVATVDDPFVRLQVEERTFRTAWVGEQGAAVMAVGRVGEPAPAEYAVVCLGPQEPLRELMGKVAASGVVPARISVEAASLGDVPATWTPVDPTHWDWMVCEADPGEPSVPVVEVTDPAEVDAVLDAGNPGSHARSGTPGVECWLGIREPDGTLVAVGAVLRVSTGAGHLRGVTVLPSYSGRGLGRALSAALTRRAQAVSGVATLGVYAANSPAIAIYRRLGYRLAHTFRSGPTPR